MYDIISKQSRFGPVVQLVRTLACHARGRGFEPHPGRLMTNFKSQAIVCDFSFLERL